MAAAQNSEQAIQGTWCTLDQYSARTQRQCNPPQLLRRVQFIAQLPMSTIQAGDVSAASAVAAVRQAMERQQRPLRAAAAAAARPPAAAAALVDTPRDLLSSSRSLLTDFAADAAVPPRATAVWSPYSLLYSYYTPCHTPYYNCDHVAVDIDRLGCRVLCIASQVLPGGVQANTCSRGRAGSMEGHCTDSPICFLSAFLVSHDFSAPKVFWRGWPWPTACTQRHRDGKWERHPISPLL